MAKAGRMRAVEVLEAVRETPTTTTIYFVDELCASARPGQFVMIYVPGLEEIPMSLSTIRPDGLASITVKAVGETTRALQGLSSGDELGVRGPFGHGFELEGRRPLLVGGGTGVAPLMPLVELMTSSGLSPKLIIAAKSRGDLLFLNRAIEALGEENVLVATEDGSMGFKGLATELARAELSRGSYDALYACGREPMLVALLDMALEAGLEAVQFSLERLVKCGMGLCGHCALGPYRVCSDGPVFDLEMLVNPAVRAELGRLWRDESGKLMPIPEAKR